MKTEFCPICKIDKKYKVWISDKNWKIFRCSSCRVGFSIVKINQQKLNKELNKEIYNSEKYYNNLKKRYHHLLTRYKKMMKKISKLESGKVKNILDYGCSFGLFLGTAKEFGYNIYGIDINKKNLRIAENLFKVNVLTRNELETKKYNNYFSVITIWDVLEHLKEPNEVLTMLSKKLTKEGIIAIQTPNMESYWFRCLGKKWNWLSVGDHKYFFNIQSLTNIALLSEIKVLKIEEIESGYSVFNSILQINSKNPLFLANRIFDAIVRKTKKILKKINITLYIDVFLNLIGWITKKILIPKEQLGLLNLYGKKGRDKN